MKVYVGNLSKQVTDVQLKDMSLPFGTPLSAVIIKEHGDGDSRGFGFIEFAKDDEGRAAIAGLNGKDVEGQVLKVNEAKPKSTGTSASGS